MPIFSCTKLDIGFDISEGFKEPIDLISKKQQGLWSSKYISQLSSNFAITNLLDLFVKDEINIEISSKPLKNRFVEVNTKLSYLDIGQTDKKSFFEIIYATIIQIDEKIKEKKEIEKIVLCDVQNKIYNNLEKLFINLLKDSGYPGIKIEKKIDFEKLYNERSN